MNNTTTATLLRCIAQGGALARTATWKLNQLKSMHRTEALAVTNSIRSPRPQRNPVVSGSTIAQLERAIADVRSARDAEVSEPMSTEDYHARQNAISKLPFLERNSAAKKLSREYKLSQCSRQTQETLNTFFELDEDPRHRDSGRATLYLRDPKNKVKVGFREFDAVELPNSEPRFHNVNVEEHNAARSRVGPAGFPLQGSK